MGFVISMSAIFNLNGRDGSFLEELRGSAVAGVRILRRGVIIEKRSVRAVGFGLLLLGVINIRPGIPWPCCVDDGGGGVLWFWAALLVLRHERRLSSMI